MTISNNAENLIIPAF